MLFTLLLMFLLDPAYSQCSNNCASCVLGACASCNSGYYNSLGTCKACTTCTDRQYTAITCLPLTDRVCGDCQSNCAECIGPTGCTQCDVGYWNGFFACVPCLDNCNSCPWGTWLCSECAPGYFNNYFSCTKCELSASVETDLSTSDLSNLLLRSSSSLGACSVAMIKLQDYRNTWKINGVTVASNKASTNVSLQSFVGAPAVTIDFASSISFLGWELQFSTSFTVSLLLNKLQFQVGLPLGESFGTLQNNSVVTVTTGLKLVTPYQNDPSITVRLSSASPDVQLLLAADDIQQNFTFEKVFSQLPNLQDLPLAIEFVKSGQVTPVQVMNYIFKKATDFVANIVSVPIPLPDQPYRLNVALYGDIAFKSFSFTWSELNYNFADFDSTSRELYIAAGKLVSGRVYRFRVTAGTAQHEITTPPVNFPATGGSCNFRFNGSSTLPTLLNSTFPVTITCTNVNDPDGSESGLKYQAFVMITGRNEPVSVSSARTTAVFDAYFPLGIVTSLYVIVTDTAGSKTRYNVFTNGNIQVIFSCMTAMEDQLTAFNSLGLFDSSLVVLQNFLSEKPKVTQDRNISCPTTENTLLTGFFDIVGQMSTNVLEPTSMHNLFDTFTSILSESNLNNANPTFTIDTPTIVTTLRNIISAGPQGDDSFAIKALDTITTVANMSCDQDLLPEVGLVLARYINDYAANETKQFTTAKFLATAMKLYQNESVTVEVSGIKVNLTAEMLGMPQYPDIAQLPALVVTRNELSKACNKIKDIYGQSYSINLIMNSNQEVPVQGLRNEFSFALPVAPGVKSEAECHSTDPFTVAACHWWDNQTMTWRTDGCRSGPVNANDSTITCFCTHLTEFAVLLKRSRSCDPNAVNQQNFKPYVVIYPIFSALLAVQALRVFAIDRKMKSEPLLVTHSLGSLACMLRALEVAYFAGYIHMSDSGLAFVVAVPYCVIFWIFLYLIAIWANICHASHSDLMKGNNRFKPFLYTLGGLVGVLMFSYLVVMGSPSLKKHQYNVALAASVTMSIIYICTGVGFMYYAYQVANMLQGSTSTNASNQKSRNALGNRMIAVAAVVCFCLSLECILWIASITNINQSDKIMVAFLFFELVSILAIFSLFGRTVEERIRGASSRNNPTKEPQSQVSIAAPSLNSPSPSAPPANVAINMASAPSAQVDGSESSQ